MLTFRVRLEFTPQTCDEAAAVLRSLVGPVRSEQGCSETRLLMEATEGYRLTWVEEWCSVEDFEQHLRTPAFRRILAVIELAAGPPDVEIDDVASRRGFELVEEILGRTAADRSEYETG